MFCLKQLPRISCLAIRRASKAVQIFCVLTFFSNTVKNLFFYCTFDHGARTTTCSSLPFTNIGGICQISFLCQINLSQHGEGGCLHPYFWLNCSQTDLITHLPMVFIFKFGRYGNSKEKQFCMCIGLILTAVRSCLPLSPFIKCYHLRNPP